MNYLKKFNESIDIGTLLNHQDFYYLDKTIDNLSGWKLHIVGISIEDSVLIYNSIEDIIAKYKLCLKVACKNGFESWISNINHKDYGKCATIYLPSSIFKNKLLFILLKEIENKLKDYNPSSINIIGDKPIDNKIFYRYELSKPVDPTIGVSKQEYEDLYEYNRGKYNIKNNIDPFLEKSFESFDLEGKGWPIKVTKVDFTGGGDGVYAIYINYELYQYGDYYHDKFEDWARGFIDGLKWSGRNIEYEEVYCENDSIIEEVSEMGNRPPENLEDVLRTNELFGIGNIIRTHKYSDEMEASEINYELENFPNEFSNFKFIERKEDKKSIKSILFNRGGYDKFAKKDLSPEIKLSLMGLKQDKIKVEMICYIPGISAPGSTDFDLYFNDKKFDCSRKISSSIYNKAKKLLKKSS